VPDMDGWRLFSSTYVNEHRLSLPPQHAGPIANFHDCTRTLFVRIVTRSQSHRIFQAWVTDAASVILEASQEQGKQVRSPHTPRDISFASGQNTENETLNLFLER
jgi:hypothetical protein